MPATVRANPDVLISLTFERREVHRVMVEDADELSCLVAIQKAVDEDLVAIAKTGDNLAMEYLLNKYKNFVRIKAKKKVKEPVRVKFMAKDK